MDRMVFSIKDILCFKDISEKEANCRLLMDIHVMSLPETSLLLDVDNNVPKEEKFFKKVGDERIRERCNFR